MKKVILSAFLVIAGYGSLSAQTTGVEATIHAGIPVGNTSDVASFNLGVDLAYLHPASDNFGIGVKTGFDHFFGKDFRVNNLITFRSKDVSFIPLAATAKYRFNNVFIGGDLGYAFSLTSEIKGGLLWQPKIGYSAPTWDLYAAYKGINSKEDRNRNIDWKYNAVSLGFAYRF